jgi:hypothetical protein
LVLDSAAAWQVAEIAGMQAQEKGLIARTIKARGSSKRMPLRLRFRGHQPETRQDQRAASGEGRL